MSLISVYFLFFLLLCSIIYYIVPNKIKPVILLIGNIFFYIQFGLQSALFLLFSILSVFTFAIVMEKIKSPNLKKLILGLVLFVNFGLLFCAKLSRYDFAGVFKSFAVVMGISFYTLSLGGYLIDVYRSKYKAEKNFLKFAAFSTFFPVMLQGPVSRYDELADKVYDKSKRTDIYRNFTYGAQLILWGFFKKLVVADRIAIFVNEVFDNYTSHTGLNVVIAILLYSIQICVDFSACFDICRGAAKLFGIDIMQNIRQPYFAKSVCEFWQRWHISLSKWFHDYLYISLGGSKKGAFRKYLNLFIVAVAFALWHGIEIKFIAFALLHLLFITTAEVAEPFKQKICAKLKINRSFVLCKALRCVVTFVLISFGWLVFRADGIFAALKMLCSIFTFSAPTMLSFKTSDIIILAVCLTAVFAVSCCKEKGLSVYELVSKLFLPVRWLLLLLVFTAILLFGIYGLENSGYSFIFTNVCI